MHGVTMTDEKNTNSQPIQIVAIKVDDKLIAELRKELHDLKRTVRAAAAQIETLSGQGERMKAR